jgi:hypothetical protein
VQTDLVELDMFKVKHVDEYLGLQAPIFLRESIHPATIVSGCPILASNAIANDLDQATYDILEMRIQRHMTQILPLKISGIVAIN